MAGELTNSEKPKGSAENARNPQDLRTERHLFLRELKSKQRMAAQGRPDGLSQDLDQASGFDRPDQRNRAEDAEKMQGQPKFRVAENFLKSEGITLENKENLHIGTVIKFLEQNSPNAPELPVLRDVMSQVEPWNEQDIFNETDSKVFNDRLENLIREHDLKPNEAAIFRSKMQLAHEKYQKHYQYFLRLLNAQKTVGEQLQQEKEKVGTDFSEDMAGVLQGVKENYRGMSGQEKVIAVGGLLVVAAMFLNSENPYVERLKETLGTVLKIAGGAYVANTAFKLFTGKSALDTLSQTVSRKAASPEAWQKTFKTNAERVGVLRDSVAYLGDYEFTYLAEKYRTAKLHHETKIDLPGLNPGDMKPEDVYTALDVFFTKYGKTVDKRGHAVDIEELYKNWNPPATWVDAISNEMVIHHDIDIGSSVIGDATTTVGNYVERGYYATTRAFAKATDYVSSDEYLKDVKGRTQKITKGVANVTGAVVKGIGYTGYGLGKGVKDAMIDMYNDADFSKERKWLKDFYQRNFNMDGKDPEIQEFVTKTFEEKNILGRDFPEWIQSTHPLMPEKAATGFKEAFQKQEIKKGETETHVKAFEESDANGSIYVIARYPGSIAASPEAYHKNFDEADKAAREFLKNYLKEKKIDVGDNLYRYVQLYKIVSIDGNAHALMRMPKPNSDEWKRRMAPDYGEGVKAGEEIFGTNDKIDYDQWSNESWKQEQFRLRFYVDASQTEEIKKICEFLTERYRNIGLKKAAALERPFAIGVDNGDLEAVDNYLKTKSLNLKLLNKAAELKNIEEDIADAEEDVLTSMAGMNAQLKEVKRVQIRKAFGYKVRLAILGDFEAIKYFKSNPDIDMDIQKEPQKFVDWYKKMLEKKFISNVNQED